MNRTQIEAIKARCAAARQALNPTFVQFDAPMTEALGRAMIAIGEVDRLCDIRRNQLERRLKEGHLNE